MEFDYQFNKTDATQEHQMCYKESTKRNSKTYKRILGNNKKFQQSCEWINISAVDHKHLTTFVERFLPQYSEIEKWGHGLEYSLKKNRRWNILKEIENVWRDHSEELAEMEADVVVADFGPEVKQCYPGFKRLFRNHGKIVEKTKKGKKKGSVVRWREGDSKKVEIVESKKNQYDTYSSRRHDVIWESEPDVDITITSKGPKTKKLPSKIPLKSSRISGFKTSQYIKNFRKYANQTEFNEEHDEIEENFLLEENNTYNELDINISPLRTFEETQFEDLIVMKPKKQDKKSKRVKDKQSINDQKSLKIIYLPYSNNQDKELNIEMNEIKSKEEETNIEETKIFKLNIDNFGIPAYTNWNVSYSRTMPTICEVWRDDTALLFQILSPNNILARIHGKRISDSTILEKTSKLSSICNILNDTLKTSEDVEKRKGVQIYEHAGAHRYAGPEEDIHEYVNVSSMIPIDDTLVHICDICLTECDPILSSCHHVFCASCWRQWISSSSPAGGEPRCPHPECSIILDPVAQHWLAGPALFGQMRERFLMDRLAKDPLLHQCSRCKRIAKRSDVTVASISCMCGFHYCSHCGLDDHFPASCEELANYSIYNQHLQNPETQTEVEVRRCPGCNYPWEKKWGCNHMVCGQCSTQFCWGCGAGRNKHPGYWCGGITVPLEKKKLTFLPTEIVSMEQIEIFSLCEGLRNISSERKATLRSLASMNNMEQLLDGYERILNLIRYRVMCKKMLKSRRRMTNLRKVVTTLRKIQKVFDKPKIDHFGWKSVKTNLQNINSSCDFLFT